MIDVRLSLRSCSTFRAARIPIRTLAVVATGHGRLAPELAAGIGRVKRPVLVLGCALRRSAVAPLTDGRFSGAFTPEATVAARSTRIRRSWPLSIPHVTASGL